MDLVVDLLRGLLGISVLIGICYLLSANRNAINWKLVLTGIGIQVVLALLILKVPIAYSLFKSVANLFVLILNFTEAGASFVLGNWPSQAEVTAIEYENGDVIRRPFIVGYVFIFKVLPTIIFFAALSSVLYYLGVLQKIIYAFAWALSKTMYLSGAESIAAAANVFIGQTEAPLIIKPYLEKMTRSEIMCLMTGGMATIAGGVFAAYVGFLGGSDPELQLMFATHLLTASIISAPAAIVAAKVLFPEANKEAVNRDLKISEEKLGTNLLDAISIGTRDGINLAVNVGAMLIVFIALIAMVNYILMEGVGNITFGGRVLSLNSLIQGATPFAGLNLEFILGSIFAPVAWLLGVPSQDVFLIGQLLGKKTVINEFVAFADLGMLQSDPSVNLSHKSVIIATYALCGFSNFASIGIQIGGIGALAPTQRQTLTELGILALIGGTVACFLTAIIAGILV